MLPHYVPEKYSVRFETFKEELTLPMYLRSSKATVYASTLNAKQLLFKAIQKISVIGPPRLRGLRAIDLLLYKLAGNQISLSHLP